MKTSRSSGTRPENAKLMMFLVGVVVMAILYSVSALADTTVILEDGTVIETKQNVYISPGKVYTLTELEPLRADPVEPVDPVEPEPDPFADEPKPTGTPEWCEWYEEFTGGVIAPTFDGRYNIYVQNCTP